MIAQGQLDEDGLSRLVAVFYERVRRDVELGPIFNDAIADWPAHLSKLTDFWHSVMLTSGRYKGNPMAAHIKHRAAITPQMFDRWLALWSDVTGEMLPPADAQAMQAKAGMIAESLKLSLFFRLDNAEEAA